MPDPGRAGVLPRLLVVDDEPQMHGVIQRFAVRAGFEVASRSSGADALATLGEVRPDAVLVDLQMPPGLSGIDVLRAVRVADPDCDVILMSGDATIDATIEAVKAGALDFLTKPLDFERLKRLLAGVRERIERREKLLAADADVARSSEFQSMIGRGPTMQELFAAIRRLAPHARTVLITGETGTGKELVARALHAVGPRKKRRFVTVNCSAFVETLFESELFGHVRGAFTGATENKVGLFEHADGGTLFLDEVGEIPLALQAKLLRAVENGEVQRVGSLDARRVDVIVIAATHRDLRAEAAAGRFRSDLFYRLSIIELGLAPLRERREDIPYLTACFVREIAARIKRPITGVTPAAERLLQQAPWPGNVRELRNIIERACILSENRILSERDVASVMTAAPPSAPAPPAAPDDRRIAAAERAQIERVLRETRGNKTAAAQILGMSRRTLYRWLDRLGIEE